MHALLTQCTAHTHALLTHMHCSHTCTAHTHALLIHMHCSHTCTAHTHALLTHMHCSHTCTAHTHALLTHSMTSLVTTLQLSKPQLNHNTITSSSSHHKTILIIHTLSSSLGVVKAQNTVLSGDNERTHFQHLLPHTLP